MVKCLVHPTEDITKVREAIENIFGVVPIKNFEKDQLIELVSTELHQDDLFHIRQIIHDKRIIDAVRVRLLRNRDELTSFIFLDKQAAFVEKLRLLDNEDETPPLGSIELRIDFTSESGFETFLNWFTPPTKDGKIVA